MSKSKPRITLLPDYPNWAFDNVARSIAKRLSSRFKFQIEYTSLNPLIKGRETDLLYIFFWKYKCPSGSNFEKQQIIREIPAWPWLINGDTAIEVKQNFVKDYLQDCVCATTPSSHIHAVFREIYEPIICCPNGVEFNYFSSGKIKCPKKSKLRIGWVGNPNHPRKGFNDIVVPAAKDYDLVYTNGSMSRRQIRELYYQVDVLAIASEAESQPLPLLESMAAGCFPIVTNVGIIPEIIQNQKNGIIVKRSVEEFRLAFEWCSKNVDYLRSIRDKQRKTAADEDWDVWSDRFGNLFNAILECSNSREIIIPNDLTCNFDRKKYINEKNIQISKKSAFKIIFDNSLMDLTCKITNFMFGGRFKSNKSSLIFFYLQKKIRYFCAIINRFHEIIKDAGICKAIIVIFFSLLKRNK